MELTYKNLHSRALHIANISMHILMWVPCVLTAVFWKRLPDKIAQHFNAAGEIDVYGSKITLLVVLTICFIIYGLHFAAMYLSPYIMGPENIFGNKVKHIATEEDIWQGMIIILKMIAYMDVFILLTFVYALLCSVLMVPLGSWYLPVFIGGIILDFIYFIWRISRKRREIINKSFMV